MTVSETIADDTPAPGPDERPVRWTFTVLATAVLFLMAFNPGSLPRWLEAMEPTPVTLGLHDLTQGWADAAGRAGLDRPRTLLQGLWAHRRPSGQGEAGGARVS